MSYVKTAAYDHDIYDVGSCPDGHAPGCPCRFGGDTEYAPHEHEWEHGTHMAAAFDIDGRRAACAICGIYRHDWIDPNDLPGPSIRLEPSSLPPRELPLSRGVVALIDAEDFDLVNRHHWWATQANRPGASVYVARRVRNKFVYLHRWLLGLPDGGIPQVDHINGNGLDNRRVNLRTVTATQNQQNSRGRGAVSGYKGVFWNAKSERWFASIKVNKHVRYLGSFDNPAHAALAYDAAAREAFGEYARPNFDLTTRLSLVRCSECGDFLDETGRCAMHGLLDPDLNLEGDPAFNGAFG